MINDYGQPYRPVGAPASIERVKVQYPKLIAIMAVKLDDQDYCDIFAHDDLERQKWVKSKLERDSIISAAKQLQNK